jgi:hypothetical protein
MTEIHEIELAETLAEILEESDDTTLGPTDSAIAAKALRLLAETLRSVPSDCPEAA